MFCRQKSYTIDPVNDEDHAPQIPGLLLLKGFTAQAQFDKLITSLEINPGELFDALKNNLGNKVKVQAMVAKLPAIDNKGDDEILTTLHKEIPGATLDDYKKFFPALKEYSEITELPDNEYDCEAKLMNDVKVHEMLTKDIEAKCTLCEYVLNRQLRKNRPDPLILLAPPRPTDIVRRKVLNYPRLSKLISVI